MKTEDTTTLFQGIATTGDWLENLDRPTADDDVTRRWRPTAQERLDAFEKMLPSGSGIDSGSKILEASSKRIKIQADFHHMSEHGYYDGWTEHTITITPSLANGFELKISGRNKNDIKEYLGETFDYILRHEVAKYPEQSDLLKANNFGIVENLAK